MQDLTNKVTWDGSYLEKYHSERMLRKSQRKYKRYTRYTRTCAVQHILVNLAKVTVLEVLGRGHFVFACRVPNTQACLQHVSDCTLSFLTVCNRHIGVFS